MLKKIKIMIKGFRGFLPSKMEPLPVKYQCWEIALNNYSKTKLLNLDFVELEIHNEYLEQSFCCLSMLAMALCLQNRVIPKQIANPLCKCALILGMFPTSCYASLVLWNWSLKDQTLPISVNNIEIQSTFTQSKDEKWFFIICIRIENLGTDAVDCILRNDFKTAKDLIHKMTRTLMKMYRGCSPEKFKNLRHYLQGFSGTFDTKYVAKNWNMIKENDLYYGSFVGSSAGQSSIIQALDKVMGIKHKNLFPKEMLNYMPKQHRSILEKLPITPNKEVIDALFKFRGAHYALAKYYIQGVKGTGLTDFRLFLQEMKDETKEPS